MLVLDAAQVRQVFGLRDAIGVMAATMAAFARGEARQPPRTVMQSPGAMFKPAYVGGEIGAFGIKAITMFPDNRERGLETIQGFVALFDDEDGRVLAIMDGAVITELRTAAVSAVATDLLALPQADDLALIGAGVQARSHLLAIAEVRSLRRVRVWNHAPERARAFAEWAAGQGLRVEAVPSVQDAVDGAGIVCTVTASPDPIVDAGWLADGVHLNAVGAYSASTRELHANVLARADVIAVDSRRSALSDAGDLVLALEDGALSEPFEPPELGELLTGTATGRTRDDQVTVFESLGLAIQDVAAAAFVHDRARAARIGTDVPL